MAKAKILVLDQDISWSLMISEALIKEDYDVFSANRATDALLLLQVRNADIIVADINLPDTNALSFLEQLRQQHPDISLIVCTGRPTIAQAVQAIRLGAHDYREKAVTPDCIIGLKESVAAALAERSRNLRPTAAPPPRPRGLLATPAQGFYGILSQNVQMHDIFELVQTIADSVANVLIYGETGTGKELVARAIHDASSRHGRPFVTMDCSALARELMESELFGHEKGAFTGAHDRHIGRFERANTGTLFLDEVANIDPGIQAKLLRVLQSRTFERVGGQKSISVDVRIIAATNVPLNELVAAGKFRDDLYHRLNVVEINLPPLRERAEDIPLLALEFLKRFARQNNKDVRGLTDAAVQSLRGYRWPGNVRELENVILQAVVLAKSPLLDTADLPRRITQPVEGQTALPTRLTAQLEEPEKQILINAIRQHGGNIKRTAEMLEISRTTLYAKLKKYQIDPDAIR